MAAMPVLFIIQSAACLELRVEKISPQINQPCQRQLPLSPRAPALDAGCAQPGATGSAPDFMGWEYPWSPRPQSTWV